MSANRNRAAIRMPLSVRAQTQRTFQQRFAIRYPAIAAWMFRIVLRLPPAWRLRRALLRDVVRQGIEAYNRGDYDALRPTYHPNLELVSEPEAVTLGFEPVYRGFDGWLRYAERWNTEWGGYRARPEELIDLGDGRLLAVGLQDGRGSGSGAPISNEWAALWTFQAGRVIREQYFFNHAEAFRAAGVEA
jgi:uncharacterized protein